MCNIVDQVHLLSEILTLTLQCSNLTSNQTDFAEALRNALAKTSKALMQERPYTTTPGSVGNTTYSLFSFLSQQMRNLTFDEAAGSTRSMDWTAAPTDASPGIKLHRLEIIKVVVLIAVISIILLSTCRMVFQLFVKFRPEKSP